jgi:hypothetical protein
VVAEIDRADADEPSLLRAAYNLSTDEADGEAAAAVAGAAATARTSTTAPGGSPGADA